MIEEVTDWVHVAEMLAVLVHRLEHLIKGHADLEYTNMTRETKHELKGNIYL